tara:strand:+ start:1302 stop:1625 length:324 start_codon:yes stop_codon:yes gene_type:complete
MRNIKKVQKGKTPTLLDTDKANELITAINALMNMTIERGAEYDKFEISHKNSILSLTDHTESGGGGADLDGWDTLEDVYFCIDGEASPRNILVKKPWYILQQEQLGL